MKVRTREEMAAYQRERRRRIVTSGHVTPGAFLDVTPKVVTPVTPANVTPDVTPCRVCLATEVLMEDLDDEVAALKLEVKKLVAQNALLESKLKAFTPHVDAKKSPYKFGPEWQRPSH